MLLKDPHQGTTGDRSVLSRVPHEIEPEVVRFRLLEEPERIVMAQHAGLINHDPPALGSLLHPVAHQELRDRFRLNPSRRNTSTAGVVLARYMTFLPLCRIPSS